MSQETAIAPRVSLEQIVGAQVRALRLALDMTLSDLAQAASVSAGMLSKIENGQTSPSLGTLQALAGALNIPLGSFFTTFDECPHQILIG